MRWFHKTSNRLPFDEMALTNPSELMRFLDTLGVHPKKGLSQNFLIDGNILRKIIQEAEVHPGDLVVEIGAGPGALTEALIEARADVLAIEKDPVFARALHRFNEIKVFEGDVRDFPFEALPRQGKVVANLPYHLTHAILTLLVPKTALFTSITVMVQEEVARRITAKPGTSAYGSLTVFLQFYSNPRYAFTVSHHCFYPKPKVDSAVVTFELKKPPVVKDEEAFFDFVRTAFSQRRKMLRNTLGQIFTSQKVVEALERLSLNPQARAEELSLEDFLALYGSLQVG